jgi:CPA1 family monovalent cation:H+ antiporter
MLIGRAVIAYGLLAPFRRSQVASVPKPWMTAVFWGGLRGSIPIALVLGLDQRRFGGVDAVTVVFGVVLFSLIVQGLTYKPLLDRLGLTSQADEITRYEELLAESLALRSADRELHSMSATGEIVPSLYDDLKADIDQRLRDAEAELTILTSDEASVRRRQVMLAARRLSAAQKSALSDASRAGRIGEHVARSKARAIDAAFEEGELARDSGGRLDPILFPDESDGTFTI